MSIPWHLRSAATGRGHPVLTVSSRTETGIRRQLPAGMLTLNDASPRFHVQKEWRLTLP